MEGSCFYRRCSHFGWFVKKQNIRICSYIFCKHISRRCPQYYYYTYVKIWLCLGFFLLSKRPLLLVYSNSSNSSTSSVVVVEVVVVIVVVEVEVELVDGHFGLFVFLFYISVVLFFCGGLLHYRGYIRNIFAGRRLKHSSLSRDITEGKFLRKILRWNSAIVASPN